MTLRKVVAACALASTLGLTLGAAQTASAAESAPVAVKPIVSNLPGFAGDSAGDAAKQSAPAAPAVTAGAIGSRLLNYNSGKCAVVQGGNVGAEPFQYQCLDFNDQAWGYIQLGSGFNLIKNLNSGLCLAVQGSSEGHHAIQAECNANYSDQVWYANAFYKNGTRVVQFVKQGTNLALVVQGSSDGTPLIQATTGDFNDQFWIVGA
ncbi:RICIN domain-containing protein [Kitasatospora sp. NPDC056446]|uniref:RICIN domain-containing protein n=1 Tax=Kitasatospora sp. NPDC056446 TaxID=3345819 RepID=UPI0036A110A8